MEGPLSLARSGCLEVSPGRQQAGRAVAVPWRRHDSEPRPACLLRASRRAGQDSAASQGLRGTSAPADPSSLERSLSSFLTLLMQAWVAPCCCRVLQQPSVLPPPHTCVSLPLVGQDPLFGLKISDAVRESGAEPSPGSLLAARQGRSFD